MRNSTRSGSLDAGTADLVDRSLQFGERTAEELMTPRSKIEALHADDTVADLVRQGHARPATRASRSSRATSTRPSASCTSSRSSRCRSPTGHAPRLAGARAAGVHGAVDARRRRRDDPDPRQRPADRAGGRRVRRHRGHGHRRGPDRGDRRRRPRRARRRHPRRGRDPRRLAGVGPAAHRRGRDRDAGSGRRRASTRRSAVWCCRSSATFPSPARPSS